MKLIELKEKIDEMILKDPRCAEARVFVDTEARCYHAHMIDVTAIFNQCDTAEVMGMSDFVSIYIDDSNTSFK